MLRFFRKVRRDLLADSKFLRYLKYGIGEVILVVIGILIAIQVDNWNEDRIINGRYLFGIEQLHKRLYSRSLDWEKYKDRAHYHIAVIDSLLYQPESVPPNRILGSILMLDRLLHESFIEDQMYLNYLNFNPTDSAQFRTSEILRLYFTGSHRRVRDLYQAKEGERFKDLLQRVNVPVCDYDMGQRLADYILECSNEPFSTKYKTYLLELITTSEFQSKFYTHRKKCMDIISMETPPESPILESLENTFEFLTRQFNTMEIVGSGTLAGDWIKGYKMTPVNNESTIWECKITLQDGHIKFRTDETWNFNWGIGEFKTDQLVLNGGNMPVNEGEYQVIIDIEKNTYSFNPI